MLTSILHRRLAVLAAPHQSGRSQIRPHRKSWASVGAHPCLSRSLFLGRNYALTFARILHLRRARATIFSCRALAVFVQGAILLKAFQGHGFVTETQNKQIQHVLESLRRGSSASHRAGDRHVHQALRVLAHVSSQCAGKYTMSRLALSEIMIIRTLRHRQISTRSDQKCQIM